MAQTLLIDAARAEEGGVHIKDHHLTPCLIPGGKSVVTEPGACSVAGRRLPRSPSIFIGKTKLPQTKSEIRPPSMFGFTRTSLFERPQSLSRGGGECIKYKPNGCVADQR